MAQEKLPNYLRAYRKRSGLSQREMAFLLGCRSAAKISRYERYFRRPNLETALTYEIILNTPARELFAGTFEQAEKVARRRAHLLQIRLQRRREDPRLDRKLATLTIITRRPPDDLDYRLEPLP
ncbi:MAG TPA: helix-turn-helix transcriptional regulator [Candidatus Binatia bacterium]|nr:helix-turn-helix transcriptional regulator [Candidatus Binatia bacterium]